MLDLQCGGRLFVQLQYEDSVWQIEGCPTFHTSDFLQSAIIVSLIPVRDREHGSWGMYTNWNPKTGLDYTILSFSWILVLQHLSWTKNQLISTKTIQ